MLKLKEALIAEFRIPDIDGDRCVHAHIEQASCQACVEICPENAWILDDESLGLNVTACDGCGLCVPACTEGAITQTQEYTIREEGQQKVLLLGCERTGLSEANCKCVHAVSTHDLLKLYRDGVHQVSAAMDNCNDCSRGKGERLFERVRHINNMIGSQRLSPLHYNELSLKKWQQLWKTPEKAAPGVNVSRRQFFRAAFTQTVDIVLHQSTFDGFGSGSGEFVPLGEILPSVANTIDAKDVDAKDIDAIAVEDKVKLATDIYPAIPHINPAKCNGCHACIKACPHQALLFTKQQNDRGANYQIEPSACTGCSICEDICEQDAVHVEYWSVLKAGTVPLKEDTCRSCGVLFYSPYKASHPLSPLLNSPIEDHQEDDDELGRRLCNICDEIDHNKNLFQVFQ